MAMHYLNMSMSCGAVPLITKPTRVVDSTATIIDHVITNDSEHKLVTEVIQTCKISDHFPIFCQISKFLPSNMTKSNKGFYRDKSKFNPEVFCVDLNVTLNSKF